MFEELCKSGVYVIRNTANGKCYVGSSQDMRRRWSEHLNALKRGAHHARHLQNAFNRDGAAAFSFSVLAFVPELSLLAKVEQIHIDKLKAADRNYGYNTRPVAESNRGYKFSEATREKIRQANLGKRQSDATRAKRSESLRGIRRSDESIRKSAEAKRGIRRRDIKAWAPDKFRQFDREKTTQIQADRANGMTFRAIAEKYNCLVSTAFRAAKGIGPAYQGQGELPSLKHMQSASL